MAVTSSGVSYTPRTWTNAVGDPCVWAVADRLRYTTWRKPALLYCHGNGGGYNYFTNSSAYQRFRDLLIDNGWVYIEALGKSASHWGREFAMESYAAAAKEAAAKHPLGTLVIHGRSMGGTVASSLAAKPEWGLSQHVVGLLLESAVQDMYDRHVLNGYSLNGQYPAVAARYDWVGTPHASASRMYVGASVSRRNICPNPAPASATGYDLTGTSSAAGSPTLTYSSGGFVRSTLGAASTDSTGIRTPLGAVTSGTYAFRARVRPSVAGVDVVMRAELWTSTERVSNGPNLTFTSSGDWVTINTTISVPSGSQATHVRLALFYLAGGVPAGSTLDVQYVLYESGASAGSYFDGSMQDPNMQAFIDAIAPFNPIQFSPSLYANLPVQFIHGDADDNVTIGPNPQAQLARIQGTAPYANLVTRSGGTHGSSESGDMAFVAPAWDFVRRAQNLFPEPIVGRFAGMSTTARGAFYGGAWVTAEPLTPDGTVPEDPEVPEEPEEPPYDGWDYEKLAANFGDYEELMESFTDYEALAEGPY